MIRKQAVKPKRLAAYEKAILSSMQFELSGTSVKPIKLEI
jgi:hypothetical protein